ncbi:MAG TPA: acyl-ACP desaturase [Acidimicrobiales bacterium]|nr:acyl-ACP desaturase [Acidimicrobiales bacterium]
MQPAGADRLEGPMAEALDAAAAGLYARHMARAKEWFPHQLVPWDRGRAFDPATAEEAPVDLPAGAASALWVGLLTEDNLPAYYGVISAVFPYESVMGEWTRRWAAEEHRHSIVIRDWITVTRSLDLVALERARMRQVTTGFQPGGRGLSVYDGIVYLTLQELATRIAHWNTGDLLDASGQAVLRRVAADENLHHLFYRDLTAAALAADPSAVVEAIDRQVCGFEMPGAGIGDFARHAGAIAAIGVYDFKVHYEQVVAPVLGTHWRIEELTGLSAAAEAARDHLLAHVARLRRVAGRIGAQAPPQQAR